MSKGIIQFLNKDNILEVWPAKYSKKFEVISYLSTKFEINKIYDEQDVNFILRRWSTYNDYPLLRRSLVDFGFLSRDKYGKEYTLINNNNNNVKK